MYSFGFARIFITAIVNFFNFLIFQFCFLSPAYFQICVCLNAEGFQEYNFFKTWSWVCFYWEVVELLNGGNYVDIKLLEAYAEGV